MLLQVHDSLVAHGVPTSRHPWPIRRLQNCHTLCVLWVRVSKKIDEFAVAAIYVFAAELGAHSHVAPCECLPTN